MPQGMETFRPPILPEPEELVGHEQAHLALRDVLACLGATRSDGRNRSIDLTRLPAEDLKLINQVMGEGEVTLTDARNRPLARKVFTPADYLASAGEPTARLQEGLAPGGDLAIRIHFEARGLSPAGFLVYPFYL